MNRIIAAYLALALVPASAALARDNDAVIGGATEAASTTDDHQGLYSSATRVVQPARVSGPEEVYAELPPPPRIIAVRDAHSKRTVQGRGGNWKTQQYE